MKSQREPTEELYYFCDESSFTLREEIMSVAGLAVPRRNIPAILKRINAVPKGRFRDEVKWHSTKQWNLENRKSYVECLAKLIDERLAHFHIRFADFDAYSHDGPRKRFDTVSKMFFQLFLHRAVRHYGSEYRISIRPDNGECTSQLKNFVEQLCVTGRYKYNAHIDCVSEVICANSKREPMLQLLDVTMGALTAFRNGRHLLDETSAAKAELAAYAVKALGIRDVAKNYDDGRRLSVWNVIPKRRGPRG